MKASYPQNPLPALRCPNCRKSGTICLMPDALDPEECHCTQCGYVLPVHRRVPDFAEHLPLLGKELSTIQKVNNSRLFSFYYDKAIWRPFLTRIGSGLSMAQEAGKIMQLAEPSGARAVADLACGTGRYAMEFARRLPDACVYGVDLSLNMLAQARQEITRQRIQNIVTLRGDIYQLPFADGSLDRVNCCGVLHLFKELKPVWAELNRVLRPGGIFTAWVLTFAPNAFSRFQKWLMNHVEVTFFDPVQLVAQLDSAGLSAFKAFHHHNWLIFRAIKKSPS